MDGLEWGYEFSRSIGGAAVKSPHGAALVLSCVLLGTAITLAAPGKPGQGKDPLAVDVRDFGAVGDGKAPCTPAIQKAIDHCAARGGGTVRLPAGVWLTGTVYLESNLTLVLDEGCTLLGSRKHQDYARPRASTGPGAKQAHFRYPAVLAGTDLQNVTIRGEGTIDGQGEAFRDKSKPRPKNLYLQNCRNVVIRNCTVSSHCNAIKLGTESGGGFQEIELTGCTVHSPRRSQKIYGAQRGLAGIALEIVDGGRLEKVTVSGVRIDGVSVPIFLRLGDRARSYGPGMPKPGVGTFQNVVLRDITAENVSEIGCSITGLPGHPIRDVVLENLQLSFDGGGIKDQAARAVPERPESYPESTMFGTLPAYGFYCRHVEGLALRNVRLRARRPDLRHAVLADDVKRLKIEALEADCAKDAAAVLRFVEVDGAEIRRCKAPAAANPFLLLEGSRTRQVVLEQNDLSGAAKQVDFGGGASAQAVLSH